MDAAGMLPKIPVDETAAFQTFINDDLVPDDATIEDLWDWELELFYLHF